MSAAKFLNALVSGLPMLEVLAKMSSTSIDDWLLDLARRIAGDDDAMEQLSKWLSWLPLLESDGEYKNQEPVLPDKLGDMEVLLLGLRGAIQRD